MNQQAIQAYSNKRKGWTRADLLIALYDETAASLDGVARAIQNKEGSSHLELHTKAILLLEQIVSGVDPEVSESADDVFRICQYAVSRLEAGDVEGINAAAKSLRTIQDGFEAVREQAIAMENRGEIPPIEGSVEVEG